MPPPPPPPTPLGEMSGESELMGWIGPNSTSSYEKFGTSNSPPLDCFVIVNTNVNVLLGRYMFRLPCFYAPDIYTQITAFIYKHLYICHTYVCICMNICMRMFIFVYDVMLVDQTRLGVNIKLESWQKNLDSKGLEVNKTKAVSIECNFREV